MSGSRAEDAEDERARVASVGSVNVDRVAYLDEATLADLAATYDWFPAPGETRRVETVPPAIAAHVTERFEGGKGANQAVAAARAAIDERHAGPGSALFGKVGTDHAEYGVLDALAGRGVAVDAVEVADAPTGAAYVFVAPDGENHIAIVGGANDAVDPAYVRRHRGAIRAADAVLVQNELPTATTEAVLADLAGVEGGPTTVLNPSPAAGAERLLAADPDVVIVNELEHAALRGALAGRPIVIRTRGPDPVVVEGPGVDGGGFSVRPPRVSPVDTTGAGDVFAGYLGAELARGVALRAAVETAVVAAALSTEREGVQRSTPTMEAVRAFRAGRGRK